MKDNIILIGADHLGLSLKDTLRDHLEEKGFKVEDIGVDNNEPVDYPDVGEKLAKKIANGDSNRGILCCGTGAGMAIVANKIPGVRAVCINDPYTAREL
jgi:sugar-phosphate isomerases, RpiB/LacA/LacB family